MNVLSEGRSRRKGVVLSAVKSNIGHLEGAAGIAGESGFPQPIDQGECYSESPGSIAGGK